MSATTASPAAPRPAWYMVAAIAALLWNLIGVAMFAMQYTLSSEALAALPAEQQSLYAAMPGWTWGAYAVAVGAGALGSLMLVLRRRPATWLLLLSLLAVAMPVHVAGVPGRSGRVARCGAGAGPAGLHPAGRRAPVLVRPPRSRARLAPLTALEGR